MGGQRIKQCYLVWADSEYYSNVTWYGRTANIIAMLLGMGGQWIKQGYLVWAGSEYYSNVTWYGWTANKAMLLGLQQYSSYLYAHRCLRTLIKYCIWLLLSQTIRGLWEPEATVMTERKHGNLDVPTCILFSSGAGIYRYLIVIELDSAADDTLLPPKANNMGNICVYSP